MANLTLTQPNLSTSHLKKMAEEGSTTVAMALTLASTPDMMSSVDVFRVVHAVLTSLALSVNVLHLVIIYGFVCQLCPPLQVLTSVALADLLAPWAIMSQHFPRIPCQDNVHTGLLLTSHNATALSLLLLASCHYCATFRPLHYNTSVSPCRVWLTVIAIWTTAIITAHAHFIIAATSAPTNQYMPPSESLAYCDRVEGHTDVGVVVALVISTAVVMTAGAIYGMLLLHLRPLTSLSEGEGQPRKCTHSVISGVLLLCAYFFSWMPYLVTKFQHAQAKPVPSDALQVALWACEAAVLLGNKLTPVVCVLRMCSLQMGYYRMWSECQNTWQRLTNCVLHPRNRGDLPSSPLNPIESIC